MDTVTATVLEREDYDIVVSYSKMNTWTRCTQAYHLKYHLKLEPKRKAYQLASGDVIHGLLESSALGLDSADAIQAFEKEYFLLLEEEPELLPTAIAVVKGYERYYKDEDLDYVAVEQHFGPILLADVEGVMIGFEFVVDAIVRDKDGRLWLKERKTSQKQFKDASDRVIDLQTCLYVWGVREYGFDVRGVMWDEIRVKIPTEPRLLKRGGLSKAQKMDTDYRTYRRAIKKHGLDRKDYKAKLHELKRKKNGFFRRQRFPIKEDLVENMRQVAIARALDILMRQDNPPIKSWGFICRWCDFKPLCEQELLGLDTAFILKAEYRRKGGKKKEARRGTGK